MSQNHLAKPGASTHDVYANDGTFSWGSETPWDAQQSFRVVTIMLASDW